MGHLPIANQETIKDVFTEGHISIKANLPDKKMIDVISSMFADVLAVRKGDLIFPWIIKGKNTKNLGFKYVFKASGSPIFLKGDNAPIKIPLEKEGLEFEKPLSEAEALDLWNKKLLWNIIGKKSLGRGKGFSHQLPMEDDLILELLKKKNHNTGIKINLNKKNINGESIHINTQQKAWDLNLKKEIESSDKEEKISKLKLKGLPWIKDRYFLFEKTLEAWLMENIDKPICKNLLDMVLPNSKLIWFGSYLPFGVQGSNIDVVLIQSKENEKFITVIELKVNSLNSKEFEHAANQSIDYSLFLKRAFNSFDENVKLNPVIISGLPKRKVNLTKTKIIKEGLSPKWISYYIEENGEVKFKENF